ncbi:hypothetical protein ACV3NQ_10830 [Clostridium perfringens]|nr:hypothetical protein [Clostridium perfringens]
MKTTKNKDIYVTRRILLFITIISIIIEMIFFPSISNLVGCIMILICYFLFSNFFLKRDLIINAPFSFFMFSSIFLYRYLPLLGTLLEGKPISFGMVDPIKTFILETILFCIACLAFYFSTINIKKTNILQVGLNMFGFYKKSNERTIWILGIVGLSARIITLAMGNIETGNIIGKALNVLFYYMYTPIILFFPCFYKSNYKISIDIKNKKVWIYVIFISLLNLATNSRNKLITPFAMIILIGFLALLINNKVINKLFRPQILIKGIVIFCIGLFFISSISKAMLINRNIREEISFPELIESTINTLTSGNIKSEWELYNKKQFIPKNYDEGWTETYIDNFLLNRFCNIRITDETLYLAEKIGGNNKMLEDFKDRIISVLPQPIINILGLDFNKENYYNSRGDVLYFYSNVGESWDLGGFRVTSHLGDGIATFGILYFILQLIMWYFVMILLNSLSIYTKRDGRVYSIYGLLTVYTSLLMFGNANGMISDILYCLRGYWQEIILFIIIYKVSRIISCIRIT